MSYFIVRRIPPRAVRRMRHMRSLGDICTIDGTGARVCVASDPGGTPPVQFLGPPMASAYYWRRPYQRSWSAYANWVQTQNAAGIPVQLPGQPLPLPAQPGSAAASSSTSADGFGFDVSSIPTWGWLLIGGLGAFLLVRKR